MKTCPCANYEPKEPRVIPKIACSSCGHSLIPEDAAGLGNTLVQFYKPCLCQVEKVNQQIKDLIEKYTGK